ncbi:hypothetical protein [Actinoplanes rectilineatus]|nr:hypothetical protein [Actinoplanes rectilineatus]
MEGEARTETSPRRRDEARTEPDPARFHLNLEDSLKPALTATLLGVLPRA